MNEHLNYAKKVAQEVAIRRRAELYRRRMNLANMQLMCDVDIELRNDLVRELDAQIKQLDETISGSVIA